MEIKNLVSKPNTAHEKWLEEIVEIRIGQFVSHVGNPSDLPQVTIHEYKNYFKKIENEWASVVSHNILHGRKSKRIMLQSVGKFNIDSFIEKKLKFKMHHINGHFARMNYSYYSFVELSKMQVAMLLYKYGYELMDFELRLAVIELLFNYFQLYTEYDDYGPFPEREWIVKVGEIEKCLTYVSNLSTEDIKTYMDCIDPNYRTQIKSRSDTSELKKHLIPQSKEELMKVLKEGMTQTEKAKAIQDYWEVSNRTARTWMKRFGITRGYRLNNQIADYTTASNTVLARTEKTDLNNERFDSLSQQISERDTQIRLLQSQLDILAEENQKLKEEKMKLISVANNPNLLIERNRLLGMSNEQLNKKVKELEEQIREFNSKPKIS